MIIGPWTHGQFSGSFPEREFGPEASSDAIDLSGLHLRWFDRWLQGIDNGVEREAPVMIFVMGIDQWRTETDWPLPDTQYRPYYLHSTTGANSLRGDGTLSAELPSDERPDTFLSDPLRPLPSVGGQAILSGSNVAGPRDQRTVEECDDVLVYSTPVLDRPVEVTGPIELILFVASFRTRIAPQVQIPITPVLRSRYQRQRRPRRAVVRLQPDRDPRRRRRPDAAAADRDPSGPSRPHRGRA